MFLLILLNSISSGISGPIDGKNVNWNHRHLLFIGDSPVHDGSATATGFYRTIQKVLKSQYPKATLDIEANRVWTSMDVYEQLDRMITTYHPTDIILIIGTIEAKSFSLDSEEDLKVDLAQYHRNIQHITAKALLNNINITLCTPLVLGERSDYDNPQDNILEEMIGMILHVVVEYKDVAPISSLVSLTSSEDSSTVTKDTIGIKKSNMMLPDSLNSNVDDKSLPIITESRPTVRFMNIREELVNAIEEYNKENLSHNILTYDGIHLNDRGHNLIANCLLSGYLNIFPPIHAKGGIRGIQSAADMKAILEMEENAVQQFMTRDELEEYYPCMHSDRDIQEFSRRSIRNSRNSGAVGGVGIIQSVNANIDIDLQQRLHAQAIVADYHYGNHDVEEEVDESKRNSRKYQQHYHANRFDL